MLDNTQRFITEVLSRAMSIKDDRDAITEYDLDLPKAIEYFKLQLLGLKLFQSSNNESAIYDNTDVSSLPPAESDKEKNEPDVPPLNW